MARHRTAEQIEALRRQQKDLADKLKEALKKAAENERKQRAKYREAAGDVVLSEFEADPNGPFASAFRIVAEKRLTKDADRAFFGLAPLPTKRSKAREARNGQTPRERIDAAE